MASSLPSLDFLGSSFEFGQSGDVAVQIGEPDSKRIEFRMGFGEKNTDVFCVVPGQIFFAIAWNPRLCCEADSAFLVFFRNVIAVPRGNFYTTLPGLVITAWQPRREFNCRSAAMSSRSASSSSISERFSAPSFTQT